MALTITDKIMRSDVTPHTAELHHFEAGDAWRVSWLPQRLMDRNAAITAMTLADLVSADGGIGLSDDPRWPDVADLAAELGLSGPDAVAHTSEPPAGASRAVVPGQPGCALDVARRDLRPPPDARPAGLAGHAPAAHYIDQREREARQ